MLHEAEAVLDQLDLPLPISAVLPRLLNLLATAGSAVLVSPPGTGKTTLVPLALADQVAGTANHRVIVAEPRRVAARAAARRMASLLGEEVGGRVGYTVRGDRRVGPATRIEVVTTGVLVQRLQRDAELPGVGAVILDECHERHLDTDLALAFGIESRAALRPDLLLLATSATAEADRLAAVLGPDRTHPAPVIGADAPLFEVEPIWCPPTAPVDPPRGLRVDPRFLDHVAAVVRRAFAETTDDLLVFLPGTGEINAVANRLAAIHSDGGVVLRLHGRLAAADQDAVLRPGRAGDRRRIVLSSAVAESSLTVPGVRTVVDAGLAREPRMDLGRGLSALVTVRVSRAGAHQRAGRAGREGPGRVYRCWSQVEHGRLPAHPEPEIAIADLTGFALALAQWGDPDGADLALLDAPPAAAMTVARQTLQALDAVDDAGRVTARGRRLATAGVHPRLARALLDGGRLVGTRRTAELVAILGDDSLSGGTDDLALAWRRLRTGSDPAAAGRWREETRRLQQTAETNAGSKSVAAERVPDDLAAGIVAGLAFPERLAKSRSNNGSSFLMAIGTAAEPSGGSGLAGAPWLAIAVAQRQAGSPAARVRLAAVIDEATAREVGAALLRSDDEVRWLDDDVVARRIERLGAITLAERPLLKPAPELVEAALREGLRREGLGLLRWSPNAVDLRSRLAFCRSVEPAAGWPDMTDAALLTEVDRWLGPELRRARNRADLASLNVATALRRLLDHRHIARLDAVAPERIQVPSGSRVKLAYEADFEHPSPPVLAVKLQETFGWASAPRIADGKVPLILHLLSPAGRPVAVTSDLASFWAGTYRTQRAQLRGAYPRHPWPEDPTTAVPTKKVTPRRR